MRGILLATLLLGCLQSLVWSFHMLSPGNRLLFRRSGTCIRATAASSLFDGLESEEKETLSRITTNYLTNKFRDCNENGCRDTVSRSEAEALLSVILPPVTKSELATEVDLLMKKFSSNNEIELDPFIDAVQSNTYWSKAGAFVVKELMYLDCLYNYYGKKAALLDDEDYSELKEQLTWEGSDLVNMSGKEAKFLVAVAAYRRGENILGDQEYESLKAQLLAEKSWVVSRQLDGLEKLGVDTFMGYLHRSLN